MSSITDIADLIATHRARLERAFDGEIARLRTVHGDRAIDAALRIVEQAQRSAIHCKPAPAPALRSE
jgi:hypothetical protein